MKKIVEEKTIELNIKKEALRQVNEKIKELQQSFMEKQRQ